MPPLKIMYVEDEPDIRNIACIAMANLGGFTVCNCASGFEACEKIETFAPDLLVLDMMMPGMNGLETLEKLRASPAGRDTPVIFMTAKVQNAEIARYLDQGALGVIAKPFNPLDLAAQVKALWDRQTSDRVSA